MRSHLTLGACLAGLLALGACGAPESDTADAESLRAAFAGQIEAVETVSGFERDGNEMTFSGPDGSGGEVAWRVVIDSAVVQPWEDESLPYRGVVLSTWYAGGEEIRRPVPSRTCPPISSMPGLPRTAGGCGTRPSAAGPGRGRAAPGLTPDIG